MIPWMMQNEPVKRGGQRELSMNTKSINRMDKEKFNNMQDYVTLKKKPIKSLDTKAKQYGKQNPGDLRIESSSAAMATI
mgnify:CR=1 FL=1